MIYQIAAVISADDLNIMDITTAAGATAFQQSNLANQVQMSVAAKALDAQRQEGADVLKLLQSASQGLSAGTVSPGQLNVTA